MSKRTMRGWTVLLAAGAMAACGGGAANPDGGARSDAGARTRPPQMTSRVALRMSAGTMPPAGATTMGVMTRPMASTQAIPIVNVEVFVFQADWNEDSTMDPVYWAYDAATMRTYIWATGTIECSGGASGAGAFVMEVNSDGSGAYMFVTDECPDNNLFGCDFDTAGNETTCGACAFNDTALACVAAGG